MPSSALPWPVGTWVRIKTDPSRRGTITGKSKTQGNRLYAQVRFPDQAGYQTIDNLEPLPTLESEDPLDDIANGRFGRPSDLRRSLTHIRLNGRLADLIYSMETTNTDFFAYQFKPVLKFLDSPADGILIADEVGLGKTIEAGLIWTELRARFDARSLVVICPAMLREKWRRELIRRFGVDARIVTPAGLQSMISDYQSGTVRELAAVCSLQGFRPPRDWEDEKINRPAAMLARLLRDAEFEEPIFDLLVVDEAHYLRNDATQMHELVRLTRGVSAHVVFLSATPVHLRSRDLFNLVRLIDESTFSNETTFDWILEANEPIVELRDRVLTKAVAGPELGVELQKAMSHPLFLGNRQLETLHRDIVSGFEPSAVDRRVDVAQRLDRANLLSNVISRTRKRDVEEFKIVREAVPEAIELNPVERKFYDMVTETVRMYAQKRGGHEAFLLVAPQRQMSSCMAAALTRWQRHAADESEETLMFEDLGATVEGSSERRRPLLDELALRASRFTTIKELREHDSKYERFRSMIEAYVHDQPSAKIIVFSFFLDTLSYLSRRLLEDGLSNLVLTGQTKEKDETINQFRDGSASVLLASEVACEGVDLQFSRFLVNYDLPWNPMRVEQRIGRIDRIGQTAERITIWNLFYANTIDARIYVRLYDRLDLFRRCLGELEAVLGDEMRTLTEELMSDQLTAEQESARIEQTVLALENKQRVEVDLEEQAGKLVGLGDYVLNEVRAARELGRWISASDLVTYVADCLERHYPGSEMLQVNAIERLYDVSLSPSAALDFKDFLGRSKGVTKTGFFTSATSAVRVVFENRVGHGDRSPRRGVEVINQFHPFIRFIASSVMDDELVAQRCIAARIGTSATGVDPGNYAFVVHMWSVSGIRDIERMAMRVRPVDGGTPLSDEDADRLVLRVSTDGGDWVEARTLVNLGNVVSAVVSCQVELEARYESYVSEIEAENQDRADIQERSVRSHWDAQRQKLGQIKVNHEHLGRTNLAKATQGRIDALERRMSLRLEEITRRRVTRHHWRDICLGVVRVE